MALYRTTLRKISGMENKYFVEFLAIFDENDIPTGAPPIQCYFSEIRFDYRDYTGSGNYTCKTRLLSKAPKKSESEESYCLGPIYCRDGLEKNPTKFLQEMMPAMAGIIHKGYQVEEKSGENKELYASFYETIGERPEQQDAVLINRLDNKYNALNEEQVKLAILETFRELQNNYKSDHCGSTAIVCAILNGKIYIANLGDSTAYHVKNDTVERLNVALHDELVISKDGMYGLRTNGVMGDNEFGDLVKRVPDIYSIEIHLSEILGTLAKIILACDGLTEQAKYFKKEAKPDVYLLKEMLKKHKNYTPEILAKSAILEYASGDNISVIIVDLLRLLQNKINAVFAVFDGHGTGAEAFSKALSENFIRIFCQHLDKVLAQVNTTT
jgi:serine/threonine protein phosphatase PrpC